MADPRNQFPPGQNRPPDQFGGQTNNHGFVNQHQVPQPPGPGNGQWKGGPPMNNGPMSGPQGMMPVSSVSAATGQVPLMRPPSSNVNGFSSGPTPQRPPQPNMGQPSGPRPGMPGQTFMNGPNMTANNVAPINTNQFNSNTQQRPGMPPIQGQFRPPGPPQTLGGGRPPLPGQTVTPPTGVRHPSAVMPPRMPTSVPQGMPPQTLPMSQGVPPQVTTPPQSIAQEVTAHRPNELPVPFHGQGQYNHQVGMALTPGITPINSAPPSHSSSRTNSPAVIPQNFDALEGQFTGTPEKEQQPRGPLVPTSQWAQPPNQQPGFPPAPAVSQQGTNQIGQPGFQPVSTANQIPGFPPMPNQNSRFPAPTHNLSNHQPNFPAPTNTLANQRPGFPPPPVTANQQPGFTIATPNQRAGFPPPPVSANQVPGFPPRPNLPNQQPGFPPPVTNQHPGFPPTPTNQQPMFPTQPPTSQPGGYPPQPGMPPQPMGQRPGPGSNTGPPSQPVQGKGSGQFGNSKQQPQNLSTNFSNMALQGSSVINLLQEKRLIPPEGVETPKPNIPNDFKNVNCSPEVFRCTLNAIPQTSALLNKARMPLGILIHPFKDLSQLPVIQSSVIVRCRSCRTYINPFVYFVDGRRWKCNLCYRVNELPDEFSFDPVTKTYGDPQRRPEVRSATIEFIAPSEYMLRPPQPAVYLYLIDVSFNAVETGYLNVFCETLLDVIDKIPGDSRTQIGFVAYDSAVHFFNLAEGLSQPQMLTVSDVDDIFIPCPDDLLVNLNESKSLVIDLLNQLPILFEGNMETRSALGAALQTGLKMTSSTGGRVTVMQTILPTIGPGALQNREDASVKAAKDVPNLGPATDFYKKLALDCSAQQVAVDLFMFNGQYADLASIECISKYSGGSVYYYPSYHAVRSPHLCEKFEADLRRYLTRKVGFESVMRIRCSKGLSIHTFHGNFFVRSTDLLSLPNINPDAGFGMQMSIEESLTDMSTMCFQAALLYTSSKGERRIRVHTLCLPVTNQLSDIYANADQQAIAALLAKMAVDRSVSSSMSDAREAIVNAAIDILNAYGGTIQSSQRMGTLCINEQLRLVPMYCLALLKSLAFRTGQSTKLDDRTYALHQFKTLPVANMIQMVYPDLYPVHTIMEVQMLSKPSIDIPALPILQLSSAHIDRQGAYILDTGDTIYLYIGSAINSQFCQDILDKPNFQAIEEGGLDELPELENEGSDRLRSFISYLLDGRPNGAAFIVVREDGRLRMQFFQHFVEDRTESSMSYYEFLQHIQKQVKT